MTDPRLLEHVETAAHQRSAARRLRLAGIVLASAPHDAAATALVALSLADLREAAPFLDRADALARARGALDGYPPACRALVEAARAVRDLSTLDPHAAGERLVGLVGVDLPEPLAEIVVRLVLAATAATGEEDLAHRALKRADGLPGLKRERAWFAWLAAARMAKPDAPALFDRAEAGAGYVRAYMEGTDAAQAAGNPGAFGDAGNAPLLAAVLPGLFRVGGLPERKPLARAA